VYKVPGGKLVAVEFGIADGTLHEVVVTGDFFLYPEEALPILSFAIEGASITEDRAELTRRIAAAIPSDVELVGATPEALAIAVERGLHAPDPESVS
jgi:lipoate---protein ligase